MQPSRARAGGRWQLRTYLFRRAAAHARDNCRLRAVLWPYGPFRKWPAFRGKAGPLPSIEPTSLRSQGVLLPSCATYQLYDRLSKRTEFRSWP